MMSTTARRSRGFLLAAVGAAMLLGLGGCSFHAGCRELALGLNFDVLHHHGRHGHNWGHHGWVRGGCR